MEKINYRHTQNIMKTKYEERGIAIAFTGSQPLMTILCWRMPLNYRHFGKKPNAEHCWYVTDGDPIVLTHTSLLYTNTKPS